MNQAKKLKVAIVGASGYAGGEILRLLVDHPFVEVGALLGAASAGSKIVDHHPHLVSLANREIVPVNIELLGEHDVIFFALPHGESGRISDELAEKFNDIRDFTIIDVAADHRLESKEEWGKYYGGEFANTWTYGLPELMIDDATQRKNLVQSKKVAVAGCNVTAVTLALQPAIRAGIIKPDTLNAVLANGFSGAGKSLKQHLLAAEGINSASPYAVGGIHRHIPEIKQNLAHAGGVDAQSIKISFTPTLVPMTRGILATCTAKLTDTALTSAKLREIYEDAYSNEQFVNLLPSDVWPTTAQVFGSNTANIQITIDEDAQTIVAIAAIDNLVRGTAGQAIQSMNIINGFPEETGLTINGIAR